jgi:hypothetical protein
MADLLFLDAPGISFARVLMRVVHPFFITFIPIRNGLSPGDTQYESTRL